MNVAYTIRIGLAVVVAGAGAAVPLLVTPMTTTAWLLLIAAEAAAIEKVLSVKTGIAGDAETASLARITAPDAISTIARITAPTNAVEKEASKLGGTTT